jgi:hypothetical protein
MIDKTAVRTMALAFATAVFPWLVGGGCGKAPGRVDVPGDGSADGAAGPDARNDAGAAGGFWTAFVPGGISNHLFVVTSDWWALEPGVDPQRWTFDTGVTWTEARSGFISTVVVDQTFFMLGKAADGSFLARWTRPSCNLVASCFSPSAPGMEGDTFLIRYDLAAKAWIVVDQFPAAWSDAQSMTAYGNSLWLHGSAPPVYRFDGPGQWAPFTLPANVQTIISLRAGGDGTLYLGAQDAASQPVLYQLPPAGSWMPLPSPPPLATIGDLLVDGGGRTFLVAGNARSNRGTPLAGCLFRQDGQQWTDVTPPFPDSGTLFPSTHQLFRSACSAGVSPAGTLAVTSGVTDSDTSQRSPMFVFVSPDQGASWIEHSAGLNNVFARQVEFDPDGRIYLLANLGSSTIWRSPTPDLW